MAGEILGVSGNDIIALACDLAAVEIEVDDALGKQARLRSGGLVVGWSSLPYFSQFSASGSLAFNAEFPTGVNSYRAYRLPWPDGESGPHRR